MGSSNIFTNTLDSVLGTDTSGQKKKAKRQERELKKQAQAQKAEQEKEKKKQQDAARLFYESTRQGNLGLLETKKDQTIG